MHSVAIARVQRWWLGVEATEVEARIATCMLLQFMERQAAHRQQKFLSQWLRSLQVRAMREQHLQTPEIQLKILV